MKIVSKLKYTSILMGAAVAFLIPRTVSADQLTSDSWRALQQLVAQNPAAAKVKKKCIAVLVFPKVVKAGFIVGAQEGPGILFVGRQADARYRTVAASYGLQAGVERFGYALFFMNQNALDWIHQTRGWEIGTGPNVVIVDKGMAREFSTDTLHSGIYAFTFDQQGLMAGLGLQGTKIMRTD